MTTEPSLYVHCCGHCGGLGCRPDETPCRMCEAAGVFFTTPKDPRPRLVSDLRHLACAAPWFRNHYHCSRCDESWHDDWSAACDDRCPNCNTETEPYYSHDTTAE